MNPLKPLRARRGQPKAGPKFAPDPRPQADIRPQTTEWRGNASLRGVRIAVLSDVHGNLPALEAVLVELEQEEPDLVVLGGDVASGPLPGETIHLLRPPPVRGFVAGNPDRGLVSR